MKNLIGLTFAICLSASNSTPCMADESGVRSERSNAKNSKQLEIQFVAQQFTEPLTVQILSSQSFAYAGYEWFTGRDEQNRLRYTLRKKYGDNEKYVAVYKTSAGVDQEDVAVEGAGSKTLENYLRSASHSCPLTLELDRKTFRILTAKSACDPLN